MAKSKHLHLLDDPDVRRWYNNVSRGSVITADERLRRLGRFCEATGNPMGTFQTFSSREQAERRYKELVDLALKYLTKEPVRLPWAHRRASK